MKDPSNPMGREVPINETVKAKLEEEKQKQVLDEIVANNPVEVAEDFDIPQPSQEEIQKMQEEMMPQGMSPQGMSPEGMQPPPPTAGTKPGAPKTAPKK